MQKLTTKTDYPTKARNAARSLRQAAEALAALDGTIPNCAYWEWDQGSLARLPVDFTHFLLTALADRLDERAK